MGSPFLLLGARNTRSSRHPGQMVCCRPQASGMKNSELTLRDNNQGKEKKENLQGGGWHGIGPLHSKQARYHWACKPHYKQPSPLDGSTQGSGYGCALIKTQDNTTRLEMGPLELCVWRKEGTTWYGISSRGPASEGDTSRPCPSRRIIIHRLCSVTDIRTCPRWLPVPLAGVNSAAL